MSGGFKNNIETTSSSIVDGIIVDADVNASAAIAATKLAAPGGEFTLDAMFTDAFSSGWIEGGTINDAGGGNITIDAGECFIRTGATSASALVYRAFAALGSTAIPLNTTRYITLTYAAGTMTPAVGSVENDNSYNIIYIGEVHNVGGTLQIHNDHRPAGDALNRFQTAWSSVVGIRVNSGEVATEPTALKLAVSAGASNDRFGRPITTAAFDSSGAGTFTLAYRNGVGDFTRTTGQTTLPVTSIDTNTGSLVAITGAKYANLWVIRGVNGDVCVQYGQAEYNTQALAEAEEQPATRPEEYTEHGFYVAKLTFRKNAAALASITSVKPVVGGQFGTAASSTPTAHNDLTGLQGGVGGQYYHLTSAEYTGTGTGNFVRATAPTFATSITGSYLTASEMLITDASKNVVSAPVATYPSLTELIYLKGVTSAIQTQLNGKQASGTYATGTGTASGTNTGDQTSIVGITGTMAQFDTAVSDGNIVYQSQALGTPTSGTLTSCTGLPIAGLVASTSTALGVGSIELGHATDTTISRSAAGVIAVEGVVIPSISSTNTFTNKRIQKRVVATTQAATPTINTDNGDIFEIVGLAQAITSMTTNLSGTPVEGEMIEIIFKDNATARAITWGASFVSSTATLPATTVISTPLAVLLQYRTSAVWTATSAWYCLAVA